MNGRYRVFGAVGVASLAAGAMFVAQAASPSGDGARAGSPVVVELYQSQGCSSCPPANANLNAIADRPDVIPLSFAVTYWDRLGWKDTFGQPAFTARQWDYARSGGRTSVATPQVVINGGRTTIVGNNRAQLDAAIAAARHTGGPAIKVAGDRVQISGHSAGTPATVWAVRYDPRSNNIPIRAGENNGRTLPHRNIVRQLISLGTWSGGVVSYRLPPVPNPVLRTAILVQAGKGGRIEAAARG